MVLKKLPGVEAEAPTPGEEFHHAAICGVIDPVITDPQTCCAVGPIAQASLWDSRKSVQLVMKLTPVFEGFGRVG